MFDLVAVRHGLIKSDLRVIPSKEIPFAQRGRSRKKERKKEGESGKPLLSQPRVTFLADFMQKRAKIFVRGVCARRMRELRDHPRVHVVSRHIKHLTSRASAVRDVCRVFCNGNLS